MPDISVIESMKAIADLPVIVLIGAAIWKGIPIIIQEREKDRVHQKELIDQERLERREERSAFRSELSSITKALTDHEIESSERSGKLNALLAAEGENTRSRIYAEGEKTRGQIKALVRGEAPPLERLETQENETMQLRPKTPNQSG